MPTPLHLAAALDGAGWHPGAWRSPGARPKDLLCAPYWTDLVQRAEAGLLDFVTIEDSLALQTTRYGVPDHRTDLVRGRLDAVLVASRVAPTTQHVGLVPSVTVTHTEPFHVSKAMATLDYVSNGRAGVRVQVSGQAHEAALFGRRAVPPVPTPDASDPQLRTLFEDLLAEASDYVEVLRRLWDSWEDGAEIRDAATGRFIDRDKLHHIDFEGRWFSVKGPSITPRPPQGQPVVTSLAHSADPARFGGAVADVVFLTPRTADDIATGVAAVREGQQAAGRADQTVHVFADLAVLLADSPREAVRRLGELDGGVPSAWSGDDVLLVPGTATDLGDVLEEWQSHGISGFRLRPAALPVDLELVTTRLVPELQRRGLFRTTYEDDGLRTRLGLPRPANRFAV